MKSVIKKSKQHRQLPAVCKIVLVFAIGGIIAGYITGNFLKDSLYSPLLTIYNETISNIAELDINKSDIFWLAVKRNIKLFILVYLFSLTNLWSYYYCAFSLYTGFTNGLLLAFNIILHNISGIPRFLLYHCPQALFFIPLYLILIAHCNKFHNEFVSCSSFLTHENTYNCSYRQKKGKLILQQFPFVIICIILITAGCFIEANLNLPLVIWYSTLK